MVLIMKSLALFALFLTSATPTAPLSETRNRQHAEIFDVVNEFLASNYRQKDINYQFRIKPLDPRLRLSACSTPLSVFPRDSSKPYGRLTFGIRCTGKKPWTIYTSVDIKAFGKVVVAKKSLPRGTLISNNHLEQRNRDLSRLRKGYLISIEDVVGKQTNKAIKAGKVLNIAQLNVQKIVRKGERVVIRILNDEIDVSMSGQALANGQIGEQIRVRNESSDRIIEGTVITKGIVQVVM